jgi:protein-L-isoaspartate(D-aspartate) O-methyltransferase
VIDAFAAIPREAYVPKSMQSIAYMDEDIVVGDTDGAARYLIHSMVLARLLQLADITAQDVVLDVGCCLGYSTAVLARLADAVVSLECDEDMAACAIEFLVEQGVDNAAVVTGPLNQGYKSQGPYDAIVLNGSVPSVPEILLQQLRDGGRLVAVVSEGALGRARVFIRHGDIFAERIAFDATVAPLPGFAVDEPAFVF